MRVRHQGPFLRTLRIHPQVHLREINSPALGLNHPVRDGGGFRHFVSLRTLFFLATFHLAPWTFCKEKALYVTFFLAAPSKKPRVESNFENFQAENRFWDTFLLYCISMLYTYF
jgi:hypothetical protein